MGLCNIDPTGVNNPASSGSDGRHNIRSITPGDTLRIASAPLELDGVPIDEQSFSILFGLSDQLFDDPIIELLYLPEEYTLSQEYDLQYGEYGDDPSAWVVANEGRMRILAGRITVILNPSFTSTLRRGSYIYSVRATNLSTGYTGTLLEGSILVRYSPTSDHRNIPYKRVFVSNADLGES